MLRNGKALCVVNALNIIGSRRRDRQQGGAGIVLLLDLGQFFQSVILGSVQVSRESVCSSNELILDHAPPIILEQTRYHQAVAGQHALLRASLGGGRWFTSQEAGGDVAAVEKTREPWLYGWLRGRKFSAERSLLGWGSKKCLQQMDSRDVSACLGDRVVEMERSDPGW